MPQGDDAWVTVLDALLLSQAFTELVGALAADGGDLRGPIRGVIELLGR